MLLLCVDKYQGRDQMAYVSPCMTPLQRFINGTSLALGVAEGGIQKLRLHCTAILNFLQVALAH